jgi:hypothetical protein
MRLRLEYLEEPCLQFGDYFEHEDPKTGLYEYGPFGKNIPGLHASEIRLGFIGTRETILGAQEWIERCSGYIESENLEIVKERAATSGDPMFAELVDLDSPEIRRLDKILNRDFVGFNKESPFQSSFQVNPRWERAINHRELQTVLETPDKKERIKKLVDLIDAQLASITQTDPLPEIVIIALTKEMVQLADTVRITGNFYLNLRRAIKGRAMNQANPIPVQIVRRRTVVGGSDVQEPAIRAWNFCTAQYHKAGGVPWIPTTLDKNTCYIGISFYVAKDASNELTMRSSVAQAFDFLGQGLVLRGDPFEWDAKKYGRSPHLTKDVARRLIKQTLEEYAKVTGNTPSRVVIHKTSKFWGSDRGEYDEVSGFYEGIDDITHYCDVDFVTLLQTGTRIFREGKYPPLRGTYFCMEDTEHFLYTMGFVPYLETYPRTYVPSPWQIIQHIGGSAPKDLFREILTLTKMNFNNCSFADGAPITISFSRKVGEIMKHISQDETVQSSYRFYM